jgi:YesN/AraC family two-component response regulator
MRPSTITETSFKLLTQWQHCACLDNSIILFDQVNSLPIPREARRLNFFFLGLCTQGSVSYTLDTKPINIGPGDAIVIADNHVVSNYQTSDDLQGMGFIISMQFYSEVVRSVSDLSASFYFGRNKSVVHLKPDEQQAFKNYFRIIARKIRNTKSEFLPNLVGALLLALFYDLNKLIFRTCDEYDDHQPTRADAIFADFIKLVESHCHSQRRVKWYADQMNLTSKYLSELIKSVSKHTANEWIDKFVMRELCVLLKNTTKSIKEISDEMHFPNQSFLGKYFKDHTGLSPTAYRRT